MQTESPFLWDEILNPSPDFVPIDATRRGELLRSGWWHAAPPPAAQQLPGDFTGDGQVGLPDLNQLGQAIRGGQDPAFDLNGDRRVDQADWNHMVHQLLRTDFGDANLDGQFDSADLLTVFQAGTYESASPSEARWDQGDWNGDGRFRSDDLLLALQVGWFAQI